MIKVRRCVVHFILKWEIVKWGCTPAVFSQTGGVWKSRQRKVPAHASICLKVNYDADKTLAVHA